MKKLFLLTTIIFAVAASAVAQNKDYKVVFDITSGDTVDYKAVVRQVTGILKANPDAKLVVAIYGNALNMVTKEKSILGDAILELSKTNKASFRVCAVTMKRHNVDATMLVPGVEVVPDAIFEIISRQKDGYGYIKVAH